jgi:hypothetical protein
VSRLPRPAGVDPSRVTDWDRLLMTAGPTLEPTPVPTEVSHKAPTRLPTEGVSMRVKGLEGHVAVRQHHVV